MEVSELFPVILISSCVLILSILVIFTIRPIAHWYSNRVNGHLYKTKSDFSIAFFHPYCNAGGGGERVLWTAIRALHKNYKAAQIIVYTGDVEATPADIVKKAKERFNIDLPPIHFIFLTKRKYVEAKMYPYFTLLGQSLGSVVLAFEALFNFVPSIFIDSMGYAFTVPVFKYFGAAQTVSYVHYPTISTDMLSKVQNRTESFNNASFISKSKWLTTGKLLYYHIFAFLYGVCGRCNDAVMVNSTWTSNHIKYLWKCNKKTNIVYPPCDVDEFLQLSVPESKSKSILSVAQFRPEKDHTLQIFSFSRFLESVPDEERDCYKLILAGSCRNEEDHLRVNQLRDDVKILNIEKNVVFKLNVSFDELKELMAEATIGLHTMKDEHFGIGVVECMAAGMIILAHNSGGPKMDIVKNVDKQIVGFLADTEQSYADKIQTIFNLSDADRQTICKAARDYIKRFSSDKFEKDFIKSVEPLISNFLLHLLKNL